MRARWTRDTAWKPKKQRIEKKKCAENQHTHLRLLLLRLHLDVDVGEDRLDIANVVLPLLQAVAQVLPLLERKGRLGRPRDGNGAVQGVDLRLNQTRADGLGGRERERRRRR